MWRYQQSPWRRRKVFEAGGADENGGQHRQQLGSVGGSRVVALLVAGTIVKGACTQVEMGRSTKWNCKLADEGGVITVLDVMREECCLRY